MNIQRFVFPNAILFRFNDDGTAVQGCHRVDVEVVKDTDTGVVYSAKELDLAPVIGEDMDVVLGVINTALTKALTQRDQTIAEDNEHITYLQGQLAEAMERIRVLEGS